MPSAECRVPNASNRKRSAGHDDPGSSHRRAAGFTLLELVVVMAIIGIAMSFVLPALAKGVRQWRIQGAVQEMVTLFKFTRNQAVARRTQLQVVMDRARRVYWLDNADAPVLTDPDQADERGIRLFSLPAGLRFGRVTIGSVTVADDRVGIAFLSRGNSTGGDVEILDDRGRRYSIRVDPLTGHARAQRAG